MLREHAGRWREQLQQLYPNGAVRDLISIASNDVEASERDEDPEHQDLRQELTQKKLMRLAVESQMYLLRSQLQLLEFCHQHDPASALQQVASDREEALRTCSEWELTIEREEAEHRVATLEIETAMAALTANFDACNSALKEVEAMLLDDVDGDVDSGADAIARNQSDGTGAGDADALSQSGELPNSKASAEAKDSRSAAGESALGILVAVAPEQMAKRRKLVYELACIDSQRRQDPKTERERLRRSWLPSSRLALQRRPRLNAWRKG